MTPKALPFALQSVSLEKPEGEAKREGEDDGFEHVGGLSGQAVVWPAARNVAMEI